MSREKVRRWFKQILIALDQSLNAILGGWADETLSSRAHRRRLAGKPRLANALDWLFRLVGDEDHCRASYYSEVKRLQAPPELRE